MGMLRCVEVPCQILEVLIWAYLDFVCLSIQWLEKIQINSLEFSPQKKGLAGLPIELMSASKNSLKTQEEGATLKTEYVT